MFHPFITPLLFDCMHKMMHLNLPFTIIITCGKTTEERYTLRTCKPILPCICNALFCQTSPIRAQYVVPNTFTQCFLMWSVNFVICTGYDRIWRGFTVRHDSYISYSTRIIGLFVTMHYWSLTNFREVNCACVPVRSYGQTVEILNDYKSYELRGVRVSQTQETPSEGSERRSLIPGESNW